LNTALFVGILHEVFSYLGKGKVEDAFRVAYNALNDDGVLIIQDFLKPPSRLVEMRFKNEETRRKFLRFAYEFRPRKVKFEETSRDRVKLDIADATEFISKYRSPNEEDWKEEMSETHFFLTEEEYQDVAQRTGFIIKDSMKLPKSENWWVEIREDIEFRFEPEYRWIQLVLVKKQTNEVSKMYQRSGVATSPNTAYTLRANALAFRTLLSWIATSYIRLPLY